MNQMTRPKSAILSHKQMKICYRPKCERYYLRPFFLPYMVASDDVHHYSCVLFSEQTRCGYTRQSSDQYLIYTDKVTDAFSDVGCKQACSQELDFNCRSYAFKQQVRLLTSLIIAYLQPLLTCHLKSPSNFP